MTNLLWEHGPHLGHPGGDSTVPSELPIVRIRAVDLRKPIITPVERWQRSEGRLVKTYRFVDTACRREFVRAVMDREESTGHKVEMSMGTDKVTLVLCTPGVDVPTELDREFAKFADVVYRDVAFGFNV